MRCFTVTVHGLVYAFGSSTVIDVTVDDPKAYTRPWTVTVHEVVQLNIEMIDEVCLENEKSFQHLGK